MVSESLLYHPFLCKSISGKHVQEMYTPLYPTFMKCSQGYTYFSYFLLQNIDCEYLLEAFLTCNHNLCFEQK